MQTSNEGKPGEADNKSSTGIESLQAILADLNAASRDIQLSMIITPDGLRMMSLGIAVDQDRVGARCADLLSLCRSTALELQRGQLEHVLLTTGDGGVLLIPAGTQAVLALSTHSDANLGLVLPEAQRAAAIIPAAL